MVEKLNRIGFTTLALDLRGHGDSSYDANGRDNAIRVINCDPVLFNAMYLDAAAADLRLEKEMDVSSQKIALVGASVGCSVALHAVTSGKAGVYAVVVMTPGANYLGVPTMEHIKSWPGIPLLLMSSKVEKNRGAAQIYNDLKEKGAELHLIDQTSIHGTNMLEKVPGVEEFITN